MEKFEAPFLLGIDVGTTGCKTELMDVDGNSVARSYREYPLIYPRISWVEHDAESGWLKGTVDTIQEILSKGKIDPKDIKGVSISCTNALVAVDKEGNPLRHAIMQFDKRTVSQVQEIREKVGVEKIIQTTGNQPAAGGTSAPIILWIKENEPEVFKKTYNFLWPGGFVIQKLTGRFTMEWSRASWTCLFETGGNQQWSEEICNALDIPIDKLPPPLSFMGSGGRNNREGRGFNRSGQGNPSGGRHGGYSCSRHWIRGGCPGEDLSYHWDHRSAQHCFGRAQI